METVSETSWGPADDLMGGPRGAEPPVCVDDMPRGARGAIEAVLMVVEDPVSEIALAAALGVPQARVEIILDEIAGEYDRDGRGFELRHVAGGWRIYSRAEYA